MNTKISQDNLKALIPVFAARSVEARQIASRLYDLLPIRFKELKQIHRGTPSIDGVVHPERAALLDKRYQTVIDELITLRLEALESRIQYETHMMLFEARQSQPSL